MEVKDLKLNFLWERNPNMFLDAPNPFWIKWFDHRVKLRNFIKECTIKQLLELLIVAYKDNYSRDIFWHFTNGTKAALEAHYEENGYTILDGKYTLKKEIKKVKDKYIIYKTNINFFKEIILEMKVDIGIKAIVEKTLIGKTYTIDENGGKTIYKIENSALEFIEIGIRSFRLSIDVAAYKDLGMGG